MKSFVASFSDTLNNLINEDLINCRKDEDVIRYIDLLCKEIDKLLGDEAEYLGYETADNRDQVKEINKHKKKRGKKNAFRGSIISTALTYARTYKFKFKVKFKDEIRLVNMPIYIPLLADDGVNYLIKGNKYCIPFQVIDSITYNTIKKNYDEVCLKTTIQDIKMQRFKIQIRDVTGENHPAYRFNIKLNRAVNKVPFILFYFATFGFYRTLKYFNLDNPLVNIKIYKDLPDLKDPIHKYYTFFKFGSLYLMVRTSTFETNTYVRDLVANILATKKRSVTELTIGSVEFWTNALGTHLSLNNSYSSGNTLKTTFFNALDPYTVDLMNTFTDGKNLKSIYAVVRWMFFKYSINVSKGISLENKRLRLAEYVITPLKQMLKKKVFQWSRIRGSFREIRRLEEVFKIRPSIIIDGIIGNSQALNIARYSASVNDLSLIKDITATTTNGPDTGSSGGWAVKGNERIHPSMVSTFDLISSSVSKPGVSRILPNCEIDTESLAFKLKI